MEVQYKEKVMTYSITRDGSSPCCYVRVELRIDEVYAPKRIFSGEGRGGRKSQRKCTYGGVEKCYGLLGQVDFFDPKKQENDPDVLYKCIV